MKFLFIMQHAPTPEQLTAASEGGREIVRIDNDPAKKALLIVPDDKELGKEWFLARAEAIASAAGGFGVGDTAPILGQAQLASAAQAAARKAGATLGESVPPRVSKETTLPDGSVKKENVFTFSGFRTVHEGFVAQIRLRICDII